jgi:hypothetical protein
MAAVKTDDRSSVIAEVNYIRNAPADPGDVLEFVTATEELSTMQTLPGEPVRIIDARGLVTDLDREGFVLVPHTSAVVDFAAIEEDPQVDQLYIAEMTELLAAVTGADKALLLGGGKKRYGETATEKLSPLMNAKPARYPHADNTDSSSMDLINLVGEFVDEIDLTQYSRYAMYNMWRAVTPPPQDIPLAVCDARSVSLADEITVRAVSSERSGVVIHDTTGYRSNPNHHWHYFSDMTRDEVIVFKAHDTDTNRSVRVPHTAFSDPSCPAGVPTRASVEARGLALFV